jgi:3-oxoacyl-(acyl-carrier-protein) synthase
MTNKTDSKRVVITGMAVNTPLGDDLDTYYSNLVAVKSALSCWQAMDTSRINSKVGGDLSRYDAEQKLSDLARDSPDAMYKRLRRLAKKAPFAVNLTLLAVVDAYRHAGLHNLPAYDSVVIVGGHNFHPNYDHATYRQFSEEPAFVDPFYAIHFMDTCQAASVSEVLGIKGRSIPSAEPAPVRTPRCAMRSTRYVTMTAKWHSSSVRYWTIPRRYCTR